MKTAFETIARLAFVAFFCCQALATDEIESLLTDAENDSISLPFHDRVQVGLELVNYYKTLGDTKHAYKLYERLAYSVLDTPISQIGQNNRDFIRLNTSLISSGDEALVRTASRMREDVISRALDSSDDSVQNNYRNVGGPVVGILNELARSREFPDLFRIAISSFPQDKAEKQTRARAIRLTNVLLNNRSGYMDPRAELEVTIPDQQKELERLQSKSDLSEEEKTELKNLKELLSENISRLNQMKASDPCWIDPRVKLDDNVVQSFTCADASIFANGDLASSEDLAFIDELSCSQPFSNYITACNIDFKIRERVVAVRDTTMKTLLDKASRDEALNKCDIPTELSETKINFPTDSISESKDALKKIQLSNKIDCETFRLPPDVPEEDWDFADCDTFLDFLKDKRLGALASDSRANCADSKQGESCFNQSALLAMQIKSDEDATYQLFTILDDEIRSEKVGLPRSTLMDLSARLSRMKNQESSDKSGIIENILLNYLSKGWKGNGGADGLVAFKDIVQALQVLGDVALKDRLMIRVVERFDELGNHRSLFNSSTDGEVGPSSKFEQ